MAARRITSVNINWASFLERAPPAQAAQAQVFKSKVDAYVRKLATLPEKPPAIDWAFYKSRISIPGMVETFQKKYEALSIPFPSDTVTSKIEQEKQERVKELAAFVQEAEGEIKKLVAELERDRSILPLSEMTMEDFTEAYPKMAPNFFTRPSHWPHFPEDLKHGEDYARDGTIPEDYKIHPCH